ncbi:T9SS type B sorting domain-containing protein [Kaistella antarctica]|uniref:Gliding motility-associated C-terminal domain n=1 Tax=Kaistella antarctica TaxID=266748 RepID=A0A3S4VGZ0_9FLAO|nr:T9SS type B sorting domain-containing protein [Kaistella antarctica]KEY20357.1 hypothetical protein HY04_03920 [Kaistella antarctica]SEV90585.1 gliding motility-associated C-terminal domain-containing protein [Kaistella antarctica]VEI01501.1 gliding motility-associated C-terminal domain [Kaistella antarctica]
MQRRIIFFTLAFLLFCCPVIGQQLNNYVKITDVFGNENPVIDCAYPLTGNCLTLKTTVPEFYQTTSYSVSTAEFFPYVAFNAGTALKVDADDSFTNKVKIPFNFCYFGNNYSEVVVGSNGVITFDTNQLGKINYPNIDYQIPNIALPKNMIFGVFSDLVFSNDNDSEIYYAVVGTAPFRKFIVNFYKGRILGCTDTSTSQIVLSEGTNTIEVFVETKPLICATAKFENSLLGIINADGSLGYSPPQRNTGNWQAQNEGWKFTPAGALIIPEITWYDSNKEIIGNGETVSVCPEKDEDYSVEVKYNICGNLDLILKDTSSVTFATDYPVAKDFTKIFCGGTSFNVDLNTNEYLKELTPKNSDNFVFKFYNSEEEAILGGDSEDTSFVLDANKIFFVRVENPADPNCFRISTLNLQLISGSLPTSLPICDINNDGVESNFQLSNFNSKLFSFPLNGTVHYFLSQANADANLNEVKTANLTDNFQLYVRYKTGSCSQTFGPITIKFNRAPIINSPIDYEIKSCDYLGDGTEPFEFNTILGGLVTSEPNATLRFYATYQQAFVGTGSTLTTIREGLYQVFVRVEIPGGCFSIGTINLNIKFTKILAKDDTIYICFDGIQDVDVNLKDYASAMLLQSPIGINTTFFQSMAAAVDPKSIPISNLQTITDNGNLVSKTFYVKFSDGSDCYAVKAIKINLVHVIIKQSKFEICDVYNDGQENVVISTLSKDILGGQSGTVYYFKTREDANSNFNLNALTNYIVQERSQLFVKIVSYTCSDIFPIDIVLTPTPVIKEAVKIVLDSVCDNNNDGLEPFDLTKYEKEIYKGANTVNFQYYTGYNPTNNSLTGLIAKPKEFIIPNATVVFVKVSAGRCFSVSRLDIALSFLPTIVLKPAVLRKCDYNFDLNESFNLADALPQLFIDSENSLALADIKVTYYLTKVAANLGAPAARISSTVVTNKSEKSVWVRFTSPMGCYSVAPIELKTYVPPKGRNSVISNLCDDNLDGLVDVDLTDFTDKMVYTAHPENIFTFYYTKSEAQSEANAIKNPEKFSFNPSVTRIWVRIQVIPGCFDTAFIDLSFGTKITIDRSKPFMINECDQDNDRIENIDLTRLEKTIYAGATFEYYPTVLDINKGTNRILDPHEYAFTENSGPQKIYAKVSAAGFCPEKVEIKLSLKKTPMFSLPAYDFCPGGFVDINPDFPALDLVSFEWINPAGNVVSTSKELKGVKTAGIYTLTVTASNNCFFTGDVLVKEYEGPVITNLIPNGNSYTVIATGSRKILYSIDGINYQDTNVFYNLPLGVTTFYVKFFDSTCLPTIKKGLVLDIKNAFTPNDDGINDTWIIDDLNVFGGEKTNLKVFNRFKEKIYEQESATRLVWDGKIHGRIVSSDSYWYVLTMADGRVFNGWVLLKNRN